MKVNRYWAIWQGWTAGDLWTLEPPEPWGICINVAATSKRKAKGRAVAKLRRKGGRDWRTVSDSPFDGLKLERRPSTRKDYEEAAAYQVLVDMHSAAEDAAMNERREYTPICYKEWVIHQEGVR